MKLPTTFPKTIPVNLYKANDKQKRPASIATLILSPTEVTREEVVYSIREKRFSLAIHVAFGKDGSPAKLTPEDVHFHLNEEVRGARDLALQVSKLVRDFNRSPVAELY